MQEDTNALLIKPRCLSPSDLTGESDASPCIRLLVIFPPCTTRGDNEPGRSVLTTPCSLMAPARWKFQSIL